MSAEQEARFHVDIYGDCGEFSVSMPEWRAWLRLAVLHGWEPAGTAPAVMEVETGRELKDGERQFRNDGGYGPPYDGQIITRADALALAAALERALPDIPDVPEAQLWHQLKPGTRTPEVLTRVTSSSSVAEKVGAQKEILKDFITHCRECSEFWLY